MAFLSYHLVKLRLIPAMSPSHTQSLRVLTSGGWSHSEQTGAASVASFLFTPRLSEGSALVPSRSALGPFKGLTDAFKALGAY